MFWQKKKENLQSTEYLTLMKSLAELNLEIDKLKSKVISNELIMNDVLGKALKKMARLPKDDDTNTGLLTETKGLNRITPFG